MQEDVLFALDAPQYHTLRIGEVNRFRGAALALSGPPLRTLRVRREGRVVLECPIDRPCPELSFLPIENAASSRFEFDLPLHDTAPLTIGAAGPGAEDVPLFVFDPSEATRTELQELSAWVARLPTPAPRMVAVTQGGDNAESYRSSVVSGHATCRTLLRNAGVDLDAIRSVLDVGCGTGRLLLGWHQSAERRRTVGVDVNGDLIAWNNSHLRETAEWYQMPPLPPLPFEDGTFDLIMLASVFTHLPLAWQRSWVAEVTRLLRGGGVVLLSLMGRLYVRALLDPAGQELFRRAGYAEGPAALPGSNDYSTFHSEELARLLVQPLEPIAVYPAGRARSGPTSWFPMAAWQDVYVLRK